MIDLALLKTFCRASEKNPWMAEPVTVKKFTYCASGFMALRVARREDVPEFGRNGRQLAGFFDFAFPRTRVKWAAIPALPAPAFERCQGCYRKRAEARAACQRCGGTGSMAVFQTIAIGEDLCSVAALRLVATLPNARVGYRRQPRPDEDGGARMVAFCFGEGDGWKAEGIGLIAPVRRVEGGAK